jgi:ketosteroid isomerase-like protein
MQRWLLLCALLVGAGCWAQVSTPGDDAQTGKLLTLEHMWNEAQVNRDSRAVQGMIADRFVNTEYDGDVSDRERFLADIRDPQFKPAFANIQDLKVNFYRDTAIVTGVYHTKGSYNGKSYDHVGRFTDTWVREEGKWLCVASHTSLLPKK